MTNGEIIYGTIREKLVFKCKLHLFETINIIHVLSRLGYERTGNKFNINFSGSKGYLSHITISCEGYQEEGQNIIWLHENTNKNGSLKKKNLNIYWSDEKGIRVSFGIDSPRIGRYKIESKHREELVLEPFDDLPF